MLVEIWSDVVCPWCAVGRARFQQAIAGFERADLVDVRWRSFELEPNRQGSLEGDYVTMLARKYRTDRQQAQDMVDRMTAAGAQEGVEFRFDIARPGNTFDAHRLLHLAADRGLQHETKARFLEGYHSEGVPIAEHGPLAELAAEAGLDHDEVTDVLADDTYAEDVRADEEQAREYGISGVPFFVFDRTAAVAGAQPAEHLLAALRQVLDETRSDSPAAAAAPDTPDSTADHSGHDGHAHDPDEACVDGVCTA